MQRPSDNLVDDVAENIMQPVVGESSSQPLITNADADAADDAMHNLELTHEFKKARIGADKVRKATPLSRRLATLKNGQSLAAAAVISRGQASLPDYVNKGASVRSITNKVDPAKAATSDLNATTPPLLVMPPARQQQEDIGKHSLRARDISTEANAGVQQAAEHGQQQHEVSHDAAGHAIGHNLVLHAFQRAVHEETCPVPHEG